MTRQDTPLTPFRAAFPQDDFTIREEMVPMRDGVCLHTTVLIPKGTHNPALLIHRTPYRGQSLLRSSTAKLDVMIGFPYQGRDYIYVLQDIRGRFQSQGKTELYRAPRGPLNETETDETTDAWDTVEWLIENLACNGRAALWGTSYPGWLALAALRDPHPALAAVVASNPVVDVWKADDWFHWGAFRIGYAFPYLYEMETHKAGKAGAYPLEKRDFYTWMLEAGAADRLSDRFDERHPTWKKLMENPEYALCWREIAADRWFDSPPPRRVPTLHVHGLWDQEDIYSAVATFTALNRHEGGEDFLVMGPWYHGQQSAVGSELGQIKFDEDTAKRYREDVLQPFLRRYLHDPQSTKIPPPARVTAFETGTNRWRYFEQWPPENVLRLHLRASGEVEVTELQEQPEDRRPQETKQEAGEAVEYLSDPAHPVPFAPRPNWMIDYQSPPSRRAWQRWMVEDQRFVEGRPDVAVWRGEPLSEPLTVRGPVTAHLLAETDGSDADWVVKLIDVFPDDDPEEIYRSGYQLMVSSEIFRGRYRESFEEARPIPPGEVLAYRIPMPSVNHTFLPGHRLMVQVQSSWFPLYDRNPQTFVESIMKASPEAYKARRHRIHAGSFLELHVD